MHVGILCEHSDPARGGAERYLEQLAARLRVHGHEVTVVSRTGPHARPVRAFPAALRPAHYRHELLPALRDAGADVVLATVPVPGCDFYQPHNGILRASIPAHLDPLPWGVRHLRRINPTRAAHFYILRRFETRAVRPPTRVLALSPRVVEDLERFHRGCEPVLLRPGVDLERFFPDGVRSDGPLLLFVAQNFRLKGLPTVLAALRRLPHARLVVVGRDQQVAADRVEYRAEVADLPALFRQADVLVHPTWYDTASSVVLEALASGTPAITTRRDGNADLAVEGGGFALADPGDADALARAIEAALAAPRDGRARAVAERFPADEMLDRVVETLTCGSRS